MSMTYQFRILCVLLLARLSPFLCSAPAQEYWCECRQFGLMEIPVKMTISAEGQVVALVERSTKEQKTYRYETKLSSEETAYLSTLLDAVDFMSRTGKVSTPNDSGNMELSVRQAGKTNVLFFNWLSENSEWEKLGDFFRKLATQAEGMRRVQSGQLDCLAQDWLQRENVVEPLKRYLRAPKSWEGAGGAFSILARNMRAEEWVGLVALCVREADPMTRDVLLYALRTDAAPISLPGQHADKLQQLLKVLGELGTEGQTKQWQRTKRMFPQNPTP